MRVKKNSKQIYTANQKTSFSILIHVIVYLVKKRNIMHPGFTIKQICSVETERQSQLQNLKQWLVDR